MELTEAILPSIDVPVLFLDSKLRIRRFTGRLAGLPGDMVKHGLDYDELAADARSAMSSLAPVQREIRTRDGHTYLASLMPCFGKEGKPAHGVVITFVAVRSGQSVEADALGAGVSGGPAR